MIIDLEEYKEKIREKALKQMEQEIEKDLLIYEEVLDRLILLPKPLVATTVKFALRYLITFRDLGEKQYYP